MKYTFFLTFLFLSFTLHAQSVFGKWKTVDEDTGATKAIIEIYEENGKVHGKILRLFKESERNRLCKKCGGKKKNKPFEGLVIIENLKKDEGNEYSDGTITNPENGKTYDCKIWLNENNPDLLNVRGYLSFLYRTQVWKRVQ